MPVRFRCVHCQQLLGIARRKAGTEVRCPECHHMVLVPTEDAPEASEATRKGNALSEGSAAAAGLQPAIVDIADGPPRTAGEPFAFPPAAAESLDAELYRVPEPARSAGLVLSPWHTLLLFIASLFILVLAFAAGLLVGRYAL